MKKKSILLSIATIVSSFLIISSCTVEDKTVPNPLYPLDANLTTIGDNLTLGGNNFYTITAGGVTLFSLSLPSASFNGVKGSCKEVEGKYVLSMVSAESNLSYTSLYFLTRPLESKTYTLTAYEEKALTDTTAWAVVTIIKDGKSWRAYDGKLIVVADSEAFTAIFDTVKVECTSNVTDTTYYKMSGSLYCK
ncbi:MAG: hypothetical protein ACKVOU_07750 [Cytophagales bacterium]